MDSVRIPKTRRVTMSEKGGTTVMTTLLTTYMPPQMAAAVNPDRNPKTRFVFVDLFSMSGSHRKKVRLCGLYFTVKTMHYSVQA